MKNRGAGRLNRTGDEGTGTPARRRRRSWRLRLAWFFLKAGLTLAMLLALLAGGLFMAVESGALDKKLTARAEGALNGTVGPRYVATVGKTAIRFAHNRQLAIEARDVTMVDQATGKTLSQTDAVRLALDPFRLLSGEINVTRIEADGVRVDTALLSSGGGIDLTRLRVDQIPALVEQGFAQLDLFGGFIDRARTDVLDVSGVELLANDAQGQSRPVGSANFTLARRQGGSLSLDGAIELEGDAVPFTVLADRKLGKAVSLKASISEVPLSRFGPEARDDGTFKEKLDANAAAEVSAVRSAAGVEPSVNLALDINPGIFRMHDIDQPFDGATIKAVYDFTKNSLEFLPSDLRFGATNFPFSGGVIDLDRIDPAAPAGFGIDLLVRGGKVLTSGSEEVANVEAQASGQYLSQTKELVFNRLAATTPDGSLIGSMKMRFGAGEEPEISFAAQAGELQTQAVKQLWPFWIAPHAREWVTKNLYGGTVSNGDIAVFLPADRPRGPDGDVELNADQLKLSFDVTNTRLNIAGDIPPLRGTTGHVDLRGERLEVNLKSGTSYFPTDRSVQIDGGTFTIANVYQKPLMADMAIAVSGAADAVAELITYRPIKFLSRTGLTPADVAGNIRADVQARFGLNAKDDVKPEWKASMALKDVDLLKPIQDRKLTGLTGTLAIDPERADLAVKGKLDGADMELAATEPVAESSTVVRKRELTVALGSRDVGRIFPSLGDVLDGPVKAKVELLPDNVQNVEADLGQATITAPGTGWTKGPGIPAKVQFGLHRDGDTVKASDFRLDGEGFGVKGEIQTRAGKLVAAMFDKVRLSANDDFTLKVKPIKAGYDIAIGGTSADVRAAITRLRSAGASSAGGDGKPQIVVRAKLDKVFGFGDETLRNVDFAYAPITADTGKLQLSGITSSGQAVVGQVADDANGHFIQVTSADAGATFRFLGLYSRVQKGLLNTRIRPGRNGSWSGNFDLRDFRLANEERLQTIVSTPAGRDGRSLNKAVKRDIDVRSERFQRGFAYFTFADGALRLDNGILRGTQVGATFQGVVRDKAGNMDVTGTFMPAYGLNRLFAELPIIGIILGNGRDRGLLGITFKLTGPFEKPNLTINPLSLIAPGIFRQIFEFQ